MQHLLHLQHLAPERLAALADEPATPEEGVHLAHCRACRREREAYVALVELARREGTGYADDRAPADRATAPLTSWDPLAASLRAEGLLAGPGGARARAAWHRGAWRAAAAVLLVAAGTALGRVSAGVGPAALGANAGADAGASWQPSAVAPRAATFASTGDAAVAMARAQQEYQTAAAYLAAHQDPSAPGSSDELRARLAALDEVMPRVRAALHEAPEDPALNHVYLTAYDVRESTLRQLDAALPAGVRLNGY